MQFDMDDSIAATAIRFLMEYLNRYYGKKVILLLDEYDTPLQEAYTSMGLLVELRGRYEILSNRESGYGRYDVLLKPLHKKDPAYILEFKVQDKEDEKTLQNTVVAAKKQIEDKNYEAELVKQGIAPEQIRKYGFAFEGKKVLIG